MSGIFCEPFCGPHGTFGTRASYIVSVKEDSDNFEVKYLELFLEADGSWTKTTKTWELLQPNTQ